MNTNQKIAKVHLTSRLRQLLVATLSVVFGISMYVFMNSFMAGVNNEQTDIAFTSMAHIKIHNELPENVEYLIPEKEGRIIKVHNARNISYNEGIKNADGLKKLIGEQLEKTSITAQLNKSVFIRNGVSQTNATLSGIDVEGEEELFGTSEYMIKGDFFDLQRRSNAVILGVGLAKSIGVDIGDNVSISTSDGVEKSFKIVGLIETGASGVDKTKALVSIQTARQLFSVNRSYATDILINVEDYNSAPEMAFQISSLTQYKVEPWQEGNGQLDSANILRNIIALAVSLTILIVAGFGIYNIMNMTVNEKIKDIAILKAMGFSGKDVIEIFLTQSIVIGFIGGILGLIFGNIISRIVDQVPFEIASLTTLPVDYNPIDYLLAFIAGMLITFLAGFLPAKKASQIDPVAILRG